MKWQLIFLIFISLFTMIFCNSAFASNFNYDYTNDIDFDNGTMAGLEHNTTHNQLQISNPPTTIPFIWVPNSNNGTVSKIDTRTGRELARYRVSPYSYSSPSRTTVDLQGNCWVANRQTGTAVKIGLYENGGYIDRNRNGVIETSRDLNDDGVISGAELLAWGADECVIYDIILIPGKEGTYVPGQYTGSYANDSYNPGPRGVAVDAQNNIWVGTYATMKFYYINGSNGQIIKTVDVSPVAHTSYGVIIDQNGIIWSSGHNGTNVLRLDPKTNSFTKINVGHFVYGLGIDRNNHLFVSGWTDSKLTKIDTLTGTIEWTKSCPTQSRGITVTDDGDIWIANSLAGTVTRYSNDGVLKATINVGNTPTGLSMDADGKVWVVNYGDEYIKRINPATNTIELSKRIPGGLHYGYSDMTGAISRTITTKLGTWTITHDSGVNNLPWGVISWNSFIPENTSLEVQVRSSNDKISWSNWEEAQNGMILSSTLPGRYLQVLVTFQIISGQTSPILYDLSVKANVADISIKIADSQDPVSAGEELTYTINVSNLGPSDARNAILSDTFPSQLQNIQYSLDNGSVWGNWTGSLNLGTLSVNSSKSVLIKGKIPSPTLDGSITNIVSVSSDTLDLNTANNVCSESTTVNTRADLAITINASNTSLHVGDTVKLTITVKNNGPSDATGVKTTYYIPNGFKHISISSNSYNPFTGLWSIGNLTSGSIVYLNVSGKVENVGLINNTVMVSGNQTDLNMTNNNASLLLSVYPNPWGHWNPLNSGNGNSNGNHYGNSGGGLGSGSGGSTQNGNGNHYGNYGDNGNLGNGQINTGSGNYNEFSIFGPFTPYLMGNDNPLSGLARDSNEAWKYNNKGSVYGPFAGILNSPFNPFGFQFYTWDKLIQAGQKAWQTGNIWDFFDTNFYHFYGYSNLNKMWGGENIKALLYYGFGIDENGNMSIANFLLNLVAIIPIGRAGTIVGKFLAGVLEKAGIKIGISLAENWLIRKFGNFLSDLTQKFGLRNPERLQDIVGFIGNVLLPNPVGWVADIFKGLAKLTGNEKLIAAATAFSSFQFKRGLGELGNLLISPDPIKKIWNIYGEIGGFLNRNLNYLADSTKKFINRAVNAVKTGIGNVINKITTTVKQQIPKAVTTVKKVVNKVINNVKTVVKKAVTTVKKTVKKVITTVRKVVTKAVNTVKKVASTVKKAVSSAVNWIKNKIRWPW
ncbi:MAG: CARDB domain-containing protein [Methanobacterium sp.]|nr:CARDB domain-containing protein [Methanobacterium sp.]